MMIDTKLREALSEAGVSILTAHEVEMPDTCIFEPPCSLKWMQIQGWIIVGAFSYAVSGYYQAVSIGRYTSIGEEVQIGRSDHPSSWASLSPIFLSRGDVGS